MLRCELAVVAATFLQHACRAWPVFGALNLQAVLTFAYHRQVYLTNLSQANTHDAAEFVEFYSAKSYFEMPDLSPKRYRYHLLSCVYVDNADAAGVARLAPF